MDTLGEVLHRLRKNEERVYPLENFFPPDLVNTATANKLFDWSNAPENIDIAGYSLGTFLDEFGKESTDALLAKLKKYREDKSRVDQKKGISTYARVNSIPEWEREYAKIIQINKSSMSISPLIHVDRTGMSLPYYLDARVVVHTHPCEQPLNTIDMRFMTGQVTMHMAVAENGTFLGIATEQSPKVKRDYDFRVFYLERQGEVEFWEGIKRTYKPEEIKRFIGENRLSPRGEDIDKFYRNRYVIPHGRFNLEENPQLADANERGHDLFMLQQTINALPVLKIPLYFLPKGSQQFHRVREIGDVYPILKQPSGVTKIPSVA